MPDAEVTTDPPICPFAACNAADNRDVVGRGRDFLYGTTAEETEIVALKSGADMTFRNTPNGSFSDWHNGPRLQYVIVLSGQMEIGIGDGTKRMFNPGDILQVEDLTGQGHTTRSVGNRISASVPLLD